MLMLLTLQGIGAPRQRKAATLLQPRVEPAFWWTGMKNPALQLMVHGKDIALTRVVVNHPGVLLKSVTAVENPNYLFVDLDLGKATPENLTFSSKRKGKTWPCTATS